MCSDPAKTMVVDRKKQKALAQLYLASGPLPYAANSIDVPTEFTVKHHDKDEVEGKFRNLNFSPSTKKRMSIQYSQTIVLLNKLKVLKKPLFQKRRRSCDFPPRKTLTVVQKHRAISRQEKMAFSSLRRVALELPSPSPRVCTGRRTYADVRIKISRIDRLPNFLTHGAPLRSLRSQRSSAIISFPLLNSRISSALFFMLPVSLFLYTKNAVI